jgi:hypothetical protein
MNLTPEDKLLLSVVKLQPSAVELENINALIPQIKDWEGFTNNIIAHGSAPLLFKKLNLLNNNSLIPTEVKTKLQQAYYKTLTRSMVLYEGFTTVASALKEAGIKVVALKGVYLSECLYGDIALRQFSDMDILVHEADGEQCLAILTGMGFKPYDPSVSEFIGEHAEIVHYTPMVKGDISVEVHIRLHRRSKQYAIKTAEFINNAIPVTINKTEVHALQLYDLLIHLCVHIDKHFSGGHIQMKCFNDIVNLLFINEKQFDWQLFIDNCRLHKCETLVLKYLIMVNKFYHVPLPEHIHTSYAYLLSTADEEKFINYLHGLEIKKYHVTTHWENMSGTKGIIHKIRYFVELVFPPKKFMIEKYGLVSSLQSAVCSEEKLVTRPASRAVEILQKQFTKFKLETKKSKLQTGNWKLNFWWLWYPYRWWVGVKGVFILIRAPNPLRGIRKKNQK